MKNLRKRILALGLAFCLCLSLCAMFAGAAVVMMPERNTYGPIDLSVTLTSSGDNYDVTYTADMTMIEWLAQAAAVCKDDARMANLRFTCTLKDALTAELSSVSSSDYTFTSAKDGGTDIFVLDEPSAVTLSGGAIKLRYKLNPAVLSAWRTTATATVKTALQQAMCMTAGKSIPASVLKGMKSASFTTTARVDVTMTEGAIPFYHENSILAAYGTCSTANPEYVGGGGGGGGSIQPDVTVVVEDKTPGDEETSDSGLPKPGGTTIVDKPEAGSNEDVVIITKPKPNSMIDHITVTDEEGNIIPLAYEGEGKFTFTMPEEGDVVVEAKYRIVPADPDVTGVSSLLNVNDHILYLVGDDKGNFRPNDSVTRCEVAMAFYRLLLNQDVEREVQFDDVSGSVWYGEAVEVLASVGILKGVGNGDFQPSRAITRAEFAAIASRFAKTTYSGIQFNDVDEDAWYADAVSTAAHFGWIFGTGNGNFEPDRPITRTETAAIINRMLQRTGDWIKIDAGEGRQFPDVSKTFWGRYEISEATSGHVFDHETRYFYEDWHYATHH